MSAAALMYHDVADVGCEDTSGFPGGDAARYKLTPTQFATHLDAIQARVGRPPALVDDGAAPAARARWLMTFDDGGASADAAADALERFGWRGHFFVTTAYIGRPGFLDARQLRSLRERGHVVGSHSHTHPLRMGRCSGDRLRDEWRRSVDILENLLGQRIRTASVPGGHYAPAVATMASEAGIEWLFTSEPTARVRRVGGCDVIGRYAVQRSTSAATAAALVDGGVGPRLRQRISWDVKRVGKTLGGSLYLRVREQILGRSPEVTWGDEVTRS